MSTVWNVDSPTTCFSIINGNPDVFSHRHSWTCRWPHCATQGGCTTNRGLFIGAEYQDVPQSTDVRLGRRLLQTTITLPPFPGDPGLRSPGHEHLSEKKDHQSMGNSKAHLPGVFRIAMLRSYLESRRHLIRQCRRLQAACALPSIEGGYQWSLDTLLIPFIWKDTGDHTVHHNAHHHGGKKGGQEQNSFSFARSWLKRRCIIRMRWWPLTRRLQQCHDAKVFRRLTWL